HRPSASRFAVDYQEHLADKRDGRERHDAGSVHRLFSKSQQQQEHALSLQPVLSAFRPRRYLFQVRRRSRRAEAIHAGRPGKDSIRHQKLPVFRPAQISHCDCATRKREHLTMTVSLDSFTESSMMLIVMLPAVCSAGMVMGLAVMV